MTESRTASPGTPVLSLADAQRRISASPYHRWLGVEVTALAPRGITVRAPWRPEWVSDPERRVTHGGILAALADLAADWALLGALGRAVPTVDLRVDYLRPAFPGALTAVGTVVKPGRQVSVSEAVITDEADRIVAVGRGTFLSSVADVTDATGAPGTADAAGTGEGAGR